MKNVKKIAKYAVVLGMIMIFAGAFAGVYAKAAGTGKINISLIGKYDSADTAAIRAIDVDNRTIRLRNHATGKTYTLSYDNTSMMYDAYGSVLSPRLLEVGQIVDVTFLKSSKKVTTLNVSKDAWTIESTRDHDLVRNDGTASIRGNTYKIDARALVMADNKPALLEDVLSTDNIRVRGIGSDIYSVMVTSGHGYVSLSSDNVQDQSLVGAWLEVGNEVIYKISPNMLLSAPEGEYKLQILGNGANYQSDISISRNEETVVDTSDITISKTKEGLVTFEITPDNAVVYVDGKRMLTQVPQSVKYGYHNLKIMADGYITQNKYLKVGTPKSVISIELEKDESASASTSGSSAEVDAVAKTASTSDDALEKKDISANSYPTDNRKTVSENSSSTTDDEAPTTIKGSKIYVDEPYGAELYFDGKYIGMIPTSLTKISGNHEVILKKEGFKTKSYRIRIDKEKGDVSYKFPPLVELKPVEAATDDTIVPDPPSGASSEASSEAASDSSSEASSESSASSDSSTDESGEAESSSDDSDSGSEASTGAHSEDEGASDAASSASHGGD